MTELKTQILCDDQNGLEQAASILSDGGLVAFPTETVYGLGADACNGHAVASVYAAKGRPSFNPLIVHVADLETAKRFAQFDKTALDLVGAFWPGPVSLVLPLAKNHGLSELVTAGLDTVAIRIPAHETAQALLKAFDGPLAAPSANPSGRISPTSAGHVSSDMDGIIDAVVDGGKCKVGIESTILKIEDDRVSLLRAGGLPVEAVEACLGHAIAKPQDPKTPQSPGQLQSHYAPNAAVRLNATSVESNEVLLGFGADVKGTVLNLSATGDMIEAAANLFAYMRNIDGIAGVEKSIAISPIPMTGLGLAINDRLKRAAAPRD
ncbi:threonylcarbamoyl-AMP synthase [Amylibacter sp. SFDW26]|uniref:L-threonylcarbamoyladenylate synthase n=1 Tax=Amylibacter sp. SFDW26 TaxID=2652722 RepID=UPI001261ADA3|nr:L-threonylcarbamoyladenylate synthase [Amylibacter sp. SFDW26]KAB7613958.1 threonylcarbamoyl-AMP synthase [Amylibacter sp. SFDW26]